MSNINGFVKSDLSMEPYTAIFETTDVIFVEEGDNYSALLDDHSTYLEESIPYIDNTSSYLKIQTRSPYKIQDGDHMTQFYLGAISVVGLFILFRMMQKSRA